MYREDLYDVMKKYRSYTSVEAQQAVSRLKGIASTVDRSDKFAYMSLSMIVDYLYHPEIDDTKEAKCFSYVTRFPGKCPELVNTGVAKDQNEIFDLSFAFANKVLECLVNS